MIIHVFIHFCTQFCVPSVLRWPTTLWRNPSTKKHLLNSYLLEPFGWAKSYCSSDVPLMFHALKVWYPSNCLCGDQTSTSAISIDATLSPGFCIFFDLLSQIQTARSYVSNPETWTYDDHDDLWTSLLQIFNTVSSSQTFWLLRNVLSTTSLSGCGSLNG